MVYENEETVKTSKYNSAVAQLYRLDTLWQSAQKNALKGNLRQWNWNLDALWRELASDASPDQTKAFYRFNKTISENKLTRNKLYFVLEQKEIFLRKLQNNQGKGTAYADPEEDMM